MARLRRLFHCSSVLADGASAGREVAQERAVPLPLPGPCMAHNVGGHRRDYRTLAQSGPLFHGVELDSCCRVIRRRLVSLHSIRSAFQLDPTRRAAGGAGESSPGSDDYGNSGPGATSRISRTFVRDAGMESRDGATRVLAADGIRLRDGHGNDSNGGCRAGKKVW